MCYSYLHMCVVNKIQQNLQTLHVGSTNSEKLKNVFTPSATWTFVPKRPHK